MEFEGTTTEQSHPGPPDPSPVEEKEQSGTVLGYWRKYQITNDRTTNSRLTMSCDAKLKRVSFKSLDFCLDPSLRIEPQSRQRS